MFTAQRTIQRRVDGHLTDTKDVVTVKYAESLQDITALAEEIGLGNAPIFENGKKPKFGGGVLGALNRGLDLNTRQNACVGQGTVGLSDINRALTITHMKLYRNSTFLRWEKQCERAKSTKGELRKENTQGANAFLRRHWDAYSELIVEMSPIPEAVEDDSDNDDE